MKSLDLEKVIILLSILLLPVAGYWVYHLNDRIEKGRAALARETAQPEGTIVQIHTLQQQIVNTRRNLDRASVGDPGVYFQQQISDAQKGAPTLSQEDFSVHVSSDGAVRAKDRSRRIIAQDEAVAIRFVRGDDSMVNRSTINAILFNAESQSPIWKLRKLKIVNKDFGTGGRTAGAPPLEMPDMWQIMDMKFVRRKPMSPN
jgi:hypothetical protein